MAKTNFTPGPWRIHEESSIRTPFEVDGTENGMGTWMAASYSIGAGMTIVGKIDYMSTSHGFPRVLDLDECEANAHLIAAAPDMYEALKKAESLLRSAYVNITGMPELEEECFQHMNAIFHLLAKAEGKEEASDATN